MRNINVRRALRNNRRGTVVAGPETWFRNSPWNTGGARGHFIEVYRNMGLRLAELKVDRDKRGEPADASGTLTMSAAPPSIFAQMAQRYFDLGYSPIARFRKPEPERDGWPMAWSDYCDAPASPDLVRSWGRNENAQIAVCTGFNNLFVPEADTNDPKILAAILEALPQCRIARFGSKGFALLARYEGEEKRIPSIYTGLNSEKRPLVEFKWRGHNITLPPSIHRSTAEPYYWFDPHTGKRFVECPAVDELPVITDADLDRLRTALKPWTTPPRGRERSNGFDPTKVPKSRYEAWYRAGLRNAQSQLSGARDGRPTMLFRSVCALGAGVHHGFIPKFEFEGAFLDACDVNGLSGREGRHAILATIESGLRWAENDELPDLGEPKPRQLKGNGAGNSHDAKGDWQRIQKGVNQGELVKNEHNFIVALSVLKIELRFDEFAEKTVITGLDGYGPQLTKAAQKALYVQLRRLKLALSERDLDAFVSNTARENGFNRPLDYFNGLEWDKTPRLDGMLHTYFKADDTDANKVIGSKTMIAAVRRVRYPGTKFDTMMVLESPQGWLKSTSFRALLSYDERWFTDNINLKNIEKDERQLIYQTKGKIIAEISDLSGLSKAEIGFVKALLSKQGDEAAMKYENERSEIDRSFIFVGTTNEDTYLIDEENRRFWPVKCKEEVDLEALKRDCDQLWAEAAWRERYGDNGKPERIYTVKGEPAHEEILALQSSRKVHDEWDDKLHPWLNENKPNIGDRITATDAFVGAFTILEDVMTASGSLKVRERVPFAYSIGQGGRSGNSRRLAASLKRAGFEFRRANSKGFWERVKLEE